MKTFSAFTTPESYIKQVVARECPGGYPMEIKDQETWTAIVEAVNMGIDGHLEAFTRSTFDNGSCLVHPEELHILIRRLEQVGTEEAEDLRFGILYTLDVEEV